MYKRHAHFVRMYSICAHFLGFVIIPFHKEQLSVLSLQRHQDKFLKSCRAWLCLRSVSRVMQLFIITRHRYPDLLYNSRSVFCFSWRRSCVLSATMASRCLLYFSICRKKKEETMLAFEMLLLLFETISEMYVVYLLFCFVFCTIHGRFSVYYECLPQYYFYNISVGYYQVHHHVHGADFVWVHFVKHLLHLLKRGPQGDVMRPTLLNELCSRKESNTSLSNVFIQ